MRFKFSSSLLLLCAVSIPSAALAQELDSTANDQMTTTLKNTIEHNLDNTEKRSLVAFDHDGHALKSYSLSSRKLENSDSLAEFLKKDPIASCEDPKSLKPPPQCVVCKNGRIICTRAKFGPDTLFETNKR